MRTLLITISFFYLSCTDALSNRTKVAKSGTTIVPKSDTFKVICNKPNIDNRIVRSDTTFDYTNYKGHTIKSYDKEGRLIEIYVSNLFESNSKNIFSTITVYDTAGHVIYDAKTKEFICWHCYSYKYDTSGHLVFKVGYSSGELGIKQTYIYDGDKLIKEVVERPTGKVEKVY